MDSDNFDFGSDDLFSDSSFDANANSFEGFDDQIDFGGNNEATVDSNGSTLPDNAFDGQFNNIGGSNNVDTQSQPLKTKKTAIIAIIIGIVGILLVIMLAARLTNMAKKSNDNAKNNNNNNTNVTNTQQNVPTTVTNANDIMGGGPSNTQQQSSQSQTKPVVVTVGSDFNWTEITGDEDITYTEDTYAEKVFSVSEVKHYARAVDANNSRLVTKTVIIGSISGLSGTYTIDVPYSKGVKIQSALKSNSLVEFTVYVKFGDYKGRQVIDDILTYNPN